jgi:hypothetical protein
MIRAAFGGRALLARFLAEGFFASFGSDFDPWVDRVPVVDARVPFADPETAGGALRLVTTAP